MKRPVKTTLCGQAMITSGHGWGSASNGPAGALRAAQLAGDGGDDDLYALAPADEAGVAPVKTELRLASHGHHLGWLVG